eukprot:gnl/Chilomastix_caulleri/3908.p2 GENE.gnl/Chilomastix_caulleri/3908~~gnl/Chilomastix_caulleri/3908.p2  ORF type:complete len:60 (+),score=12.73 gnl/Chilomastix_caulleri/3908:204-383(+)
MARTKLNDVYVSGGESILLNQNHLDTISQKKCVCWSICENDSASLGNGTSELWFLVVDN